MIYGIKPGKKTFNSSPKDIGIIHNHIMAEKISNFVHKHTLDQYNKTSSLLSNDLEFMVEKILSESKKEIIEKMNKIYQEDHIRMVIPNSITLPSYGGKRDHPNQKPLDLLKFYIELLTNEGDLILDTFAGSGSTGYAAKDLKRNFILIERENKYFKLFSNIDN